MDNKSPQMNEASSQCEHPMFNNVSPYSTKISEEIRNSKNPGRPLIEAVIETSNTQKVPVGPSAHDIGGV